MISSVFWRGMPKKGRWAMKRIMVAVALMGAALVLTAGVAWAATVDCRVGVFCEGTDEPDELIGTDELIGYRGPDTLSGFGGSDYLRGGRGDDRIDARERGANQGRDTVRGSRNQDSTDAVDKFKDT